MSSAKYWRVIPPDDIRYSTCTVNGRRYVGTPGVTMRVPAFDAQPLTANGWTFLTECGPTSDRPSGLGFVSQGVRFYDETIGAEISYDGKVWRNPAGATV